MPAHTVFGPCIARAVLLLMFALPLAANAADGVASPGAQREHLQLPLDDNAWRVAFEDDGDSATWRYRPVREAALDVLFDEITVAALDRALAPFPAREMPQRAHALLVAHAPGLTLDVRHGARADRVVYVLSSDRPETTTIVALAQDGDSALHTAEVELRAGTTTEQITHWVDVLSRARLRAAADSEADRVRGGAGRAAFSRRRAARRPARRQPGHVRRGPRTGGRPPCRS